MMLSRRQKQPQPQPPLLEPGMVVGLLQCPGLLQAKRIAGEMVVIDSDIAVVAGRGGRRAGEVRVQLGGGEEVVAAQSLEK
jgi:hypothetical protein